MLKIATLEVVWQTLEEQAEMFEKIINPARLVKRLQTLSLKINDIESKINGCFRSRVAEKDYTNKLLYDQLAEQNKQQQQMQVYFIRLEQKINELTKLSLSSSQQRQEQ